MDRLTNCVSGPIGKLCTWSDEACEVGCSCRNVKPCDSLVEVDLRGNPICPEGLILTDMID
jgi:hypothetical protein